MKAKSNSNFIINADTGPCVILHSGLNSRIIDPISRYLPECLLPVANIPALHFVLSNLLNNGFKRIIIYSCRGYTMLKDFVAFHYPQFSQYIEVLQGHSSKSIGDIMRDLDASESIRNVEEFIFMPADLLVSTNLLHLLDQFKATREKTPNFVMAIALKHASQHEPELNSDNVQAVVVRDADSKLVQYHPVLSHQPCKTAKDTSCLQNMSNFGLWICSKHIPPLFQDNFDYTSGEDMIHGLLMNEEVINYHIKIELLDCDQLHFRLTCDLPRVFHATRLLLRRLTGVTFHTPCLYLDQIKLKLGTDHVYINSGAKVSTTTKLLGHCLIANDCVIGPGSILIDTVLGPSSQVGSNCQLRSVICTNNVSIGDHVIADQAFLCAGARVLSKVRLGQKVFLGPSAVLSEENREASDEDKVSLWEPSPTTLCIGPDITIAPRTILLCPDKNDEILASKVIGDKGWAVAYKPPETFCDPDFEDSDDEEVLQQQKSTSDREMEDLWTSSVERERLARQVSGRLSRYNSMSRDDAPARQRSSSKLFSVGDFDTDEDCQGDQEQLAKTDAERSEDVIIDELKCTLERCLEQSVPTENIILDINSLKHAYAQNIEDMYFLIGKALLMLAKSRVPEISAKLLASELAKTVDTFKLVLNRYYKDSSEAQGILLESLEDAACYCPVTRDSMLRIVKHFYDVDLMEEDVILSWYEDSALLEDDDLADLAKEIRANMAPFVKWLREAESESD